MKIYIVRHGETTGNIKRLFVGSKLDYPLTKAGEDLAKITGEKLQGIKFDACYSSPLVRADMTSKLILEYSGNKDTPIYYDDRLKECEMGEWEGKSYFNENGELPRFKNYLYNKNFRYVRRIPGGESAKELIKRTWSCLNEVAQKDYDTVLLSTHGCALRAMLNNLYDNKFDFWQGGLPLNCAISIVEVENGKMKLISKDKVYYDIENI